MNRLMLLIVSSLMLQPQLAQAEVILFVGVEDNQIVAGKVGEPYVKLTEDPARKRLPVRSKDGKQIAYIQDSPDKSALAILVVIDAGGGFRRSWPVGHVEPGEIHGGMRFVEEVEWIDANRIAVSGSINPSTGDYEIISLIDGSVTGFVVDGAGAAFSPDGKHAAYMTGAPHFGGDRAPVLTIDEVPAAVPFPGDIEETERPVWSKDSRNVALAARQIAHNVWMIAHAEVDHGSTLSEPHALPFAGKASIVWNESILEVRNEAHETYAWRSGTWRRVQRSTAPPVDAGTEGETLRKQLNTQWRGDFWCAQCTLSALLRRSASAHD